MESIATFLADWHVRVGWIAFTTLWLFWGFTWFIRNAFGGDGTHAIQSNNQFASDPNAPSSVNPETGVTANGTNVHNKKFLAAPSWSVGVFVSILFFCSNAHFFNRTVSTVPMICFVILS